MSKVDDRQRGKEPASMATEHEATQERHAPESLRWKALRSSRSRQRILWIPVLSIIGLALAGFVLYVAVTQAPVARAGMIKSIEQGTLQISYENAASWQPVEEGQTVPQGARIRGTKATWATIALPDHSLMRIEAPGVWQVVEAMGKDNRLRITIAQEEGRASFVSPPPRTSGYSRFQVQVGGVTAELVGVGTFVTGNDQRTRVQILQGHCTLWSNDRPTELAAGEMATINPGGSITVIESK
ncbi:MAG: hypothetical protein U9R48_09105 [Chloroflexota bacterium]|nr:hypothetical protein [Chloroflexota bacterium]